MPPACHASGNLKNHLHTTHQLWRRNTLKGARRVVCRVALRFLCTIDKYMPQYCSVCIAHILGTHTLTYIHPWARFEPAFSLTAVWDSVGRGRRRHGRHRKKFTRFTNSHTAMWWLPYSTVNDLTLNKNAPMIQCFGSDKSACVWMPSPI